MKETKQDTPKMLRKREKNEREKEKRNREENNKKTNKKCITNQT